jgi:hypothetical protein
MDPEGSFLYAQQSTNGLCMVTAVTEILGIPTVSSQTKNVHSVSEVSLL